MGEWERKWNTYTAITLLDELDKVQASMIDAVIYTAAFKVLVTMRLLVKSNASVNNFIISKTPTVFAQWMPESCNKQGIVVIPISNDYFTIYAKSHTIPSSIWKRIPIIIIKIIFDCPYNQQPGIVGMLLLMAYANHGFAIIKHWIAASSQRSSTPK